MSDRASRHSKQRNFALATPATETSSHTKIESVAYAGWPNCYRLVNNDIELVVTADVGPRIIRCGFVDGSNLFAELPHQLGRSGEPWWMCRGGHRLWTAPEVVPDTYALDNAPVDVSFDYECISLLQPVEAETSLQKRISIQMKDSGEIIVTHLIQNQGRAARSVAPWALTVMAPGGLAVTAFPPRTLQDHPLQPTNPLVMWSYTDFSDARWSFTSKYLVLRQDSSRPTPQKVGIFNPHSFAAYLLGTVLFVKSAQTYLNRSYPDFHSSVELFTNADFLELETLGPLVELDPGSSAVHVECWRIYRDVHIGGFTDDELDRTFLPILQGFDMPA